jgi:hypothetical protein
MRKIPMPRLTYVNQTSESVSVDYADMPASADVVFVDQTSGEKTPSQSGALAGGGDGSTEIPIPSLPAGKYYLLAQEAGQYLAETIAFNIA